MTYLEEAAEQLRLARDANEKRAAELADLEENGLRVTAEDWQPVNDRRIRLAEIYAALAAIGEGMITETGGYDPAVALQRPSGEFRG